MDASSYRFRFKMIGHHTKHIIKKFLGIKGPHVVLVNVDEIIGQEPGHPSLLCRCACGAEGYVDEHDADCLWLAEMCRTCQGMGHCPECLGTERR